MNRFRGQIHLFVLAAIAVVIVVARAHLQSVTIDEANSCFGFSRPSWPAHWYPQSDNHVLNSILERLTILLFGLNEITLRTPAIVGAIIYIASALFLTVRLAGGSLLRLSFFLCLVYNPMILDYLVAARGYSLAIGFLTAALAVIISVFRKDSGPEEPEMIRKCAWVSILLALSFAANFSFAFACAGTLLLFLVWVLARRVSLADRLKFAAACILPGLALAIALCGSTVLNYSRDQLTFGSASISEMWVSLVKPTLDELNPQVVNPLLIPLLHKLPHWLPWAGLACLTALLALAFVHRRSDDAIAKGHARVLLLVVAVATLTFLLHWSAFHFRNLPLPKGRTGLFLVVFWTLAFGAAVALSRRRLDIVSRWVSIVSLSVMIAASIYFLGCLRLGYFKEWRFDADTKNVYWFVNSLHQRCGLSDFVTDWRYASALNFYRESYGNSTLPRFSDALSGDLPAGHAAYIIFAPTSEDFIAREQLQVVYQNDDSAVVVAIRRACEADSKNVEPVKLDRPK